jgi:tetratricopeptide (TPR) repeat protein
VRLHLVALLGEDRRALVAELVDLFDDAVTTASPRLVSLEGVQGVGKTRVIQEFYAELARRQAQPAYWPRSLVLPTTHDPLKTRKHIYPETVEAKGDAQLPWMWWGISCETSRGGTRRQTLAEDLTQLQRHFEGILRQEARRREIRGRGVKLLTTLVGAVVPYAELPITLTEAAADLLKVCREGLATAKARKKEDRVVAASDPGRPSLVQEIAEMVGRLADPQLPFVMIVDDAHEGDESVVALLDLLFQGEYSPTLLCVTTAWPDELARQADRDVEGREYFGGWLRNAAHRVPDRCIRRNLQPLPDKDIERLITVRAPRADRAAVQALTSRADGNPLVAEGLLSLPILAAGLEEGVISLALEEIEELPIDFHGVLLERWRSLPRDVQEVVCLSAIQGQDFVEALLLVSFEASRAGLRVGRADPRHALMRAVDPHAWVRAVEQLFRFHERYSWEIAEAQVGGFLTPSRRRTAERAVAAAIDNQKRQPSWEDLPRSLRLVMLRMHVRMAEEGAAEDGASAAESAFELGEEMLRTGVPREAEGLADLALRLGRVDCHDSNRLRGYKALVGSVKAELGKYAEAEAMHREVLHEAEHAFGSDSMEAVRARHALGNTLSERGDHASARKVQSRVWRDFARRLGPDHPESLVALQNFAWTLGELGDIHRARELQEAVVNAHKRIGSTASSAALWARHDLATTLGRLGRSGEERSLRAGILEQREESLGEEHPTTLWAAHDLALTCRASGETDIALELLQRVVEARTRVLGRSHPHTQRAQDVVRELTSPSP